MTAKQQNQFSESLLWIEIALGLKIIVKFIKEKKALYFSWMCSTVRRSPVLSETNIIALVNDSNSA
jgi:hypothetical protein